MSPVMDLPTIWTDALTKLQTRVTFTYKNWRGMVSTRTVQPFRIFFGVTEYHPDPQWLLEAWDCDKDAARTFALKDISQWKVPAS